MKLQFITPRIELAPYIDQFWVFESAYPLPPEKSLIAPNGKPKIIIPYINALHTTDYAKTTVCKEGGVYIIGIRDVPVTLGSSGTGTGSIGIEFSPAGAYRFLNVPLYELANNLLSFSDIFGIDGSILIRRIAEHEDVQHKVKFIQEFLIQRLRNTKRSNTIIDFAVSHLIASKGLAEIKQLEQKTGYTKRYIDMLFKEHLGVSPKTLSTILRFQHFYKQWTHSNLAPLAKETIYELYYDQSHFIKEFKRYTGLTPMQYAGMKNDFGKYF